LISNNRYILFIIAFLLFCTTAESATRVVRIRTRSADEVCDTLRQMFGERMRFASVSSINAVVIGADTDDEVNEAAVLLSQLDRRPATFRFTVKRRERGTTTTREFRVSTRRGGTGRFETRQDGNTLSETRTVTGMEGGWHLIADDLLRLESMNTPWGPETAVIRHRQGVEIKGIRASASGTAIIEVRAASGPENRTSTILSRLEVPFSRWISLGGTTGDGAGAGVSAAIGNDGRISNRKTSGTFLDDWELQVDLLDPGE